MADELKPCPFCGGKDARVITNSKHSMSWVSCPSCGLEAPTETGVSMEDAVAYWNTRPEPAAAPGDEAKAVWRELRGVEWSEDRCWAIIQRLIDQRDAAQRSVEALTNQVREVLAKKDAAHAEGFRAGRVDMQARAANVADCEEAGYTMSTILDLEIKDAPDD